jgi:hypothetical protein
MSTSTGSKLLERLLKVGTLSGILFAIANYPEMNKETLARELFG